MVLGRDVCNGNVSTFSHPYRVIVNDIKELFWLFLFVSEWDVIDDLFCCNCQIVHHRDSDFVELVWDRQDSCCSSNSFVV